LERKGVGGERERERERERQKLNAVLFTRDEEKSNHVLDTTME
jgi:hypothetical protein